MKNFLQYEEYQDFTTFATTYKVGSHTHFLWSLGIWHLENEEDCQLTFHQPPIKNVEKKLLRNVDQNFLVASCISYLINNIFRFTPSYIPQKMYQKMFHLLEFSLP